MVALGRTSLPSDIFVEVNKSNTYIKSYTSNNVD